MPEGGGENEMIQWKVSVGVNRPSQPRNRLLVVAEMNLSVARGTQPKVGQSVTRTKSDRLLDMSLGFLAATDEMFGDTDKTVSDSQISIEREGSLAFCDPPSGAICEDLTMPICR
jgi:hypothetical protein